MPTSQERVTVREFRESDRERVLQLAPRLIAGMPPWRDRDGCHAAIEQWVNAAMDRDTTHGNLLVATNQEEEVIGFIGFEQQTHFSGGRDVYVGEIVVDPDCEGRGIGTMLMHSVEEMARARGFRTVTLTTGAANDRARAFYTNLGYEEEAITLTKVIP
ncbi:MAG: N-acetyltransferase family protein, partial [Chloroflexota bacterium]